jgi:hypothetical protein
MRPFDIRVGWNRRKPLLTRTQLERLNGGPLPLLALGVRTRAKAVTTVHTPEQYAELYGRPVPRSDWPVSEKGPLDDIREGIAVHEREAERW